MKKFLTSTITKIIAGTLAIGGTGAGVWAIASNTDETNSADTELTNTESRKTTH